MVDRPAGVRVVVLLGVLAAGGCDSGPRVAEVSGVLRVKGGRPLDSVMVEFLPDPGAGAAGPRSTGMTDAEGRFRLVMDDQRPGAVVGRHRVLVRDYKMFGPVRKPARQREDELERNQNNPVFKSRVPVHYADPAGTPLHVDVKAGPQEIVLEVTTR